MFSTRLVWNAGICLIIAVLTAPRALGAELTGTYIRYANLTSAGILVDTSTMHSMQYTESGAFPYSCDVFYPGLPVEELSVEATSSPGGFFRATSTTAATVFLTTSGPTVVGRRIEWSGTYTAGATQIALTETLSYDAGARYATLQMVVQNTGSASLTDLYVLRNGEPDQGACNIGTSSATTNDVVRQPPSTSSALVVAAGGTTGVVVLGIGAADPRARVSVNTGLNNTDATNTWLAPRDTNGLLEDVGVSIAFHEPSLPVASSATFMIFYVWGPDVATVQSRFDEVSCTGIPDAAPCAGGAGTCRSGWCCPGCWDGANCQSGTAPDACGAVGALCFSCVDGDPCSEDLCASGGCSNPRLPPGTACDDGLFCTVGDACNAFGICATAPRSCDDGIPCTTDTCDMVADTCLSTVTSGCLLAGLCVAEGSGDPSNPCEYCDSTRSRTAWSPRPAGTACGTGSCSGGSLNGAPTCDGALGCVTPAPTACPSGACASPSACSCTNDATCPSGQYCGSTMRCEDQHPLAQPCARSSMCATGFCADGLCCDAACDGVCEGCALAAATGTCSWYAAGSDPDSECGVGGACSGFGACVGIGDGGADGGGDAGGGGTSGRGGCGCGVPAAGAPGAPAWMLLLIGALAAATRRRRTA